MGIDLQDGIVQGAAKGNQFRTAPLWGLGQRLFFLHDGRTTSLIQGIQAHSSSGFEAIKVINNYNRLKGFTKAGPAELPAILVAGALSQANRGGASYLRDSRLSLVGRRPK
jgi:hypothetical protein